MWERLCPAIMSVLVALVLDEREVNCNFGVAIIKGFKAWSELAASFESTGGLG
jgi:hypothetical protein